MIRSYIRNERGAAAVEFALMLGVFTAALPTTIDFGIYAFDSMQVHHSAQMALQGVWASCGALPVTSKCNSTGSSALTTAAQQTSLGTDVTVGTPVESYSCINSSGALYTLSTGTFSTPIATNTSSCASSDLTTLPGDYMTVTVTYTYTPVFRNVSLATLLGTTITATSTMRLL